MGWTTLYNAPRKQDVVDELIHPRHSDNGKKWETLAHSVRGNTLYAVQRVIDLPSGREDTRYILVALLGFDRSLRSWGYKDMTDGMGPYVFDCPLKYLDMVPCPNEYSAEWREKVRSYHEHRNERARKLRRWKKRIKPGDTLKLKPRCRPNEGVFLGLNGRREPLMSAGYVEFRVPWRLVQDVEHKEDANVS